MEINSKHAVVSYAPYHLYMMFTDMRNFLRVIPEDKKEGVEADFDTLSATVQGYHIGVKVRERAPYSKVVIEDDGAPFHFVVTIACDTSDSDPNKTDFHIDVDADLNFMMKMLIGGKIKEALDKIVDSLAAISEGRMPDGIDPSMFPDGYNPFGGNPNDGTWTA